MTSRPASSRRANSSRSRSSRPRARSTLPATDPRQAKTSNLSGGGLLVLTASEAPGGAELRERTRLWIDLSIPSMSRISREAEIVRTSVVRALRHSTLASVAAKLVGLSERERDKLIRYLFELQRNERLKRGWSRPRALGRARAAGRRSAWAAGRVRAAGRRSAWAAGRVSARAAAAR
ncbi:MAG TPA: PilZ domain-containing protein [Polyangiaceae bacterium]|nr:PilZ domain-containing protein [Polyangiaceae bacterium]